MLNKLVVVLTPTYPVSISLRAMDEDFGYTRLMMRDKRRRLQIVINKNLPPEARILTFAHEYAHCIQWREDHQEIGRINDHDAEFGIAYSKVWSLLDRGFGIEA